MTTATLWLTYIPSSSLTGVVGSCKMEKISIALRIGEKLELGVFVKKHVVCISCIGERDGPPSVHTHVEVKLWCAIFAVVVSVHEVGSDEILVTLVVRTQIVTVAISIRKAFDCFVQLTKRRSTPIGTSALGLAMRQRRENGEVRLAVGRRTDLLRQAPRLSLRQSIRNVKTNCLTPPISSALALAMLR
ncbi:hypothetical protein MRB53_012864 [Persea americana]|uniref:Uncharacterized protein n=1 Tax=Persea americana TaxID=3435 RepID=A0ACC2M076_PERAE|nr:hypothetical protein MRB53_012864 [Persea americana]